MKRSILYYILTIIMVAALVVAAYFALDELIIPSVRARSVSKQVPKPGESVESGKDKDADQDKVIPAAAETEAVQKGAEAGLSETETEQYDEAQTESVSGYYDENGEYIPFNSEDSTEINGEYTELLEMNKDTIGWLSTSDDKIDYPVVRGDDEYYLHNNFLKEKDKNGCIFLTQYNVLKPRDTILHIYGHNMASGSMFGSLSKYLDEKYMRKYPLVRFQTIYEEDKEDCWYVPVAMFSASMDSVDSAYFDVTPMLFDDKAEYQLYLDEISKHSEWTSPVDVTTDDELLMLVTCSYNLSNSRYILTCRKVRENEDPEELEKMIQDGMVITGETESEYAQSETMTEAADTEAPDNNVADTEAS